LKRPLPKARNMQTIRQSDDDSGEFCSSSLLHQSTPESQRRLSVIALSSLCDKIQDQQSLITARICRTFKLEPLMQANNLLLPKHLLMKKLEEYENLISAMSALFYVSR